MTKGGKRMTDKEAIKTLKENVCAICAYGSQNMELCDIRGCDNRDAIKALELEYCGEAISRQAAIDALKIAYWDKDIQSEKDDPCIVDAMTDWAIRQVKALPPISPTRPKGKCKDCRHFEYNSVAKVDGIPLIVAHEICTKWGDGCKTSENGFCFMFEPQAESEE